MKTTDNMSRNTSWANEDALATQITSKILLPHLVLGRKSAILTPDRSMVDFPDQPWQLPLYLEVLRNAGFKESQKALVRLEMADSGDTYQGGDFT